MRRRKARGLATDEPVREAHGTAKAGELKRSEAYSPRPAFQSVYSGRVCLGHILSRGKLGFAAFTADDLPIGAYPTAGSAADAISARAP